MNYKSVIYLLLLVMIGSACSIDKRHYNKGFHITKHTKVKAANSLAQVHEEAVVLDHKTVEDKEIVGKNQSDPPENELADPPSLETKTTTADSIKCDRIIFRDGHEDECLIKEVSETEIKYKKCGFEEGPLYTVSSSSVSAILYRNGNKEFYGNYVKPKKSHAESEDYIDGYTTWSSDPREIEVFSVLSLVFSVIYFIPGLSIVFGFIGLKMFQKEPGKYKGKGFAYAGIILGSLLLLVLLLALFFL